MKKAILVLFISLIHILSLNLSCYASIDTDSVKALIVYDETFNEVILTKAPLARIFPASITKIMTAVIVLENVDDTSETVTASTHAVSLNRVGGSSANIKAGEQLTYSQLIDALLIRSGNEVSYILAEAVGGTIENFVAMMNQKATELGLTDTNFVNPCGLHEEDHYSTAYDLLKLARYAMKNKTIAEVVRKTHLSLPPTNMHPDEGWADNINTNLLLTDEKYLSPHFTPLGIKTGSTPFARYCLMSAVVLPTGSVLYSVAIGALDEQALYGFKKHLFENISIFYEEKQLFDDDEVFAFLKSNNRSFPLYAADPLKVSVPHGFPLDRLDISTSVYDSIASSLDENSVLGRIDVKNSDNVLVSFDLVIREAVRPEEEAGETAKNAADKPNTDIYEETILQGRSYVIEGYFSKLLIASSFFSFLFLIFIFIKTKPYKKKVRGGSRQ